MSLGTYKSVKPPMHVQVKEQANHKLDQTQAGAANGL